MAGNSKTVTLGHGGGGKLTNRLLRDAILPKLDRGKLAAMPDSVILTGLGDAIAYTTDSYIVSPIFFPGGDIGSLAVHGTCNDLACSGARPLFLSLGLILEEGLTMDDLDRIISSLAAAADEAGVQVVTGDTKVAPKGSVDKIFINTSGIGRVEAVPPPTLDRIRPDDVVIVSGPIGNHGMAVMLSRAEFSFEFDLKSDSACIWPLVERLLPLGSRLRFLRDPTRGGLSAVLNEIASAVNVGVTVEENAVPVDASVVAASEILGIDPLPTANEGKLVIVVEKGSEEDALDLLKDCDLARGAAVIGRITTEHVGKVVMRTSVGGSRVIPEPSGELLPRIC